MAERTLTNTFIGNTSRLVVWDGLLNGDTGQPLELVDYGDMTVTVEGTFGVGGTIVLQGSNDGTNYYSLTEPQGNAISKTAAGIELVTETPRYIRPSVTAGDGDTDLECRIMARRGS